MEKNEKKVAVLNPYDVLGKAHNKGLDFVMERLNSSDKMKAERGVDLISQFMESLKDEHSHQRQDACSGNHGNNETMINHYIAVGNAVNRLAIHPVNELVQKSKLTEKQNCFIQSILNVSDEMALDYEGSLKILQNIEEQILASDLTAEELQLPLSMVSIAKYSVKYWMEQISSDNSKWKNFVEGDLAAFKFPWKADALGAMTGIGGGVIGAVGGAIGGSLAAALGWK